MNSQQLRSHFEDRLQENVSLVNHTSSRVGGVAAYFVAESDLNTFAIGCFMVLGK